MGAVAGAGTMMFALRDKPYLTDQERAARRAGRVAGVGGAASGQRRRSFRRCARRRRLQRRRTVVRPGRARERCRGGMVAGVAVVGAIPLLAAFAFALLAYGLMRWLKPPSYPNSTPESSGHPTRLLVDATGGTCSSRQGCAKIDLPISEPVPRVLLDTSVIVDAGYGRSGPFEHLLRDAADQRVQVIIPEVVLAETVFVYRRELQHMRGALEELPQLLAAAGHRREQLRPGL